MLIRATPSTESRKVNDPYTCMKFLQDFKSVINIFVLQCIFLVSMVFNYYAVLHKVSTTLMLHIVFCSIGFVLIMTSSILLFAGDNFFGRTLNRYYKALIHGTAIGIGIALTIAGISIEIYFRGTEWPHFSSVHAITGLVSMILMIITFILGILITQMFRIRQICPMKPIWYKLIHDFFGLFAYIIGMISVGYSVDTWWNVMYFSHAMRIIIIVVTAVTLLWTSIGGFQSILKHLTTIFQS